MNIQTNIEKKQYYGLDLLKLIMALLVVARHVVQIFYPADSKWCLIIRYWLSNLAVPTFFTIAGFLLFEKIRNDKESLDKQNTKKYLRSYIFHILRMYIIWSIIYWPIDIYCKQPLGFYLHSFIMSSTITQLWYLPALAVAVLIVGFLYKKGARAYMLLSFTGILFVLGWIGDNRIIREHAPQIFQDFVSWYTPIFMTMRNGVFYGSFYVALGAWIAGRSRRMSTGTAILGGLLFLIIMYKEASVCSNANIVLSAAPTVFCITELALRFNGKANAAFLFLREQSEWIYFLHYYFIYIFSWTVKYNPLPINEVSVMLSVLVPMLLCTLIVQYFSHKGYGSWLRALI